MISVLLQIVNLNSDYGTFQELDWESIAAGLLHDTVEDTNVVTFERINKEFGDTVRHIVEGETKVFLFMLFCAFYYDKDDHAGCYKAVLHSTCQNFLQTE